MSSVSGLLRIRVPLPIEAPDHVNLYLLPLVSGEYCLIDAGWGDREGLEVVRGQLEERGIDMSQIAVIIITHLHRDHAGGASRLKELTGARVYVERSEYEDATCILSWLPRLEEWLLEQGADDHLIREMSGIKTWLESYLSLSFDGFIEGRWELGLREGKCLLFSTPGHSAGHVVAFLVKTSELIGGDLILPHETPNVPLHPWRPSNSLLEYLSSLDYVRRLGPKAIHPSHGGTISRPVTRIDELFKHHGERLGETLLALAKTPLTALEVAKTIRWSLGRFERLSVFNKWLALLETLSHLVMLEHAGLLARVESRSSAVLWESRAG